jgi:hypothetical protein
VQRVLAARLVLRALEIGQHVVEAPAGIAGLAPLVEIFGLPADVDEPVDGRGAAEHLAARLVDDAAVELGLGLAPIEPVDPAVLEELAVAEGDVDPDVPVARAGLDQHHAMAAARAEAIGEHASGRARAHHDKVGLARAWVRRRLDPAQKTIGDDGTPLCRAATGTVPTGCAGSRIDLVEYLEKPVCTSPVWRRAEGEFHRASNPHVAQHRSDVDLLVGDDDQERS